MQLTHPIHQAFSRGFYSDSGRDYAVRLLLGYCTSGGADAGEVLATIDGLDSGHEQAWADAWLSVGRRVAGSARDSFAHGHRVSAASAYLRAANYLSTAFDGLDGLGTETQRMTVFAEHRAAWDVSSAPAPLRHNAFPSPMTKPPCPAGWCGPPTTSGPARHWFW